MSTPDRPSHRQGFIDRAPVIRLPHDRLDEPVSWSSRDKRTASLGEWLASNTPLVAERFGVTTREPAHTLPVAGDLSEEEARSVVIARLNRRDLTQGFSDGESTSTYGDHLREVVGRTEKGLAVISNELSSIQLLQELAEAGKLAPQPKESPGIPS